MFFDNLTKILRKSPGNPFSVLAFPQRYIWRHQRIDIYQEIFDKHRSIKSNHAASKEQWTTGSGAFIARAYQRVAV